MSQLRVLCRTKTYPLFVAVSSGLLFSTYFFYGYGAGRQTISPVATVTSWHGSASFRKFDVINITSLRNIAVTKTSDNARGNYPTSLEKVDVTITSVDLTENGPTSSRKVDVTKTADDVTGNSAASLRRVDVTKRMSLRNIFLTKATSTRNVAVTTSRDVSRRGITLVRETRTVRYICPFFTGGLGNTMFEYASVYGIAVQKGFEVMIGQDQNLPHVFNIQAHFSNNMDQCGNFTHRGARWGCAYDPELLKLDTTKNYTVSMYLQSWKYFNSVSDDIRKQFVFKTNIRKNALDIIEKVKKKHRQSIEKTVTLVGIHVRRGDIATNEHFIKYGYLTATKEYLAHAMDYFLSRKYTNVVFIVCSNDMTWTKKSILPKYTVEYIEQNQNIDMAVLTMCDHVIMTVGTFGWWAAWLAGGEAVYYKKFVREKSGLRAEFSADLKDYFPANWIGME